MYPVLDWQRVAARRMVHQLLNTQSWLHVSDWVNEPLIKDTLNKDIYLCVKDTFSVPTYIYIYNHNHGICTFCAKGQKPQKDESWDLHFLRQRAKAAKG